MKIKEIIAEAIWRAINSPEENVETAITKEEIELEFAANPSFGDYTTNIAMRGYGTVPVSYQGGVKVSVHRHASNISGTDPRKFAENILARLKEDKELLKYVAKDKMQIAGPGFINFFLKPEVLVDNLIQIDSDKEKYGTSDVGKGKRVVIDYSSPNIAKPFGIGHLRSTIIGQALYNLYQALGYEVIGDNHLGDWGTQFGKLIYMLKKEDLKDFDIARLEELYVQFHKEAQDLTKKEEMEKGARECFKNLEEGDAEIKSLWKKCVEVSLQEFARIYDLLGIKIDFSFGESYYETEMRQLLQDADVKNHLEVGEDGAKIMDLSKEGIKTPLMFLKSDGATTYATRDLATLKFRMRKWDPKLIIYEVGAEQTLHFQQIFAAARLTGIVSKEVELVHTAHGLYLAPDGKKFSTRQGKTIKLEEVLNEAIDRAKKLGNQDGKVAQEVGIGAIKYFDLMHSVKSDVIFDWEKMMNMEGNSGPYLQYTFVRTQSVLGKSEKPLNLSQLKGSKGEDLNPEELATLRKLNQYPEVIATAAKTYSPNLICNFLYDLAQKYNEFYNKHRIIDSENETLRLALTAACGQVVKNGLTLLGIAVPERM